MLVLSTKLIEKTTIRYELNDQLDIRHARWLRGAISRQVDRPEFHHHLHDGLVFRHPLIRYYTSRTHATIVGLAEGAFLLRGLPLLQTMRLGEREYRVLSQLVESVRCETGPLPDAIIYRFQTPYLALNQRNYEIWQASNSFVQRNLLQRIVIGNFLSVSKAINLSVSERLQAEVDLYPVGWHELKPGVKLLGFQGAIQINYALPVGWGIGKSSARGFGTLAREDV